MATILYTRFVELTDGLVKPRILTWNGKSRNAPETPPIDVKNEITKATIKGMKGDISIPETEKCIISIQYFRYQLY